MSRVMTDSLLLVLVALTSAFTPIWCAFVVLVGSIAFHRVMKRKVNA